MQSDRELLEAAARAAGLTLRDDFTALSVIRASSDGHWWLVWNPLTSDGDALRLAVGLGICFGPNFDGDLAVCFGGDGSNITQPYGDDPYAATRRAIVRAAAALAPTTPPKEPQQ